MPKVIVRTRSTSIPMSSAARLSCSAARSDWPNRVRYRDRVEQPEQDDREHESVQVDVGQVEAEDVDRLVHVRRVQLNVGDPEHLRDDPFDQDRHGIRDEDRHRCSFAVGEPSHEEPFDGDADHEQRRDRDDQRCEKVHPEVDRERVGEVRAEDDHDPLGDVDDVHHPEDQGQPGGHQRVDATR